MGPNKVREGSQNTEHNGLYWERSTLPALMVIEAAHGTCVLEAGEGHLRSGRLRLCAGPILPPQHEVSRGSWTHGIEDVGIVRNQELWPGVDIMMKCPCNLILPP